MSRIDILDSMIASGATRAEALVTHVERLIAERGMQPGDRIATRAELRDQTKLANATVNEGIRLLQDRGRVTARPGPGGGIFVGTANPLVRLGQTLLAVRGEPVTVADSVTVRDALEPLVAAEAARYRSEDDIVELRILIQQMAESVRDPDRFLRVNWRLHQRMAQLCRNHVLRTVYCGLAQVIEEQAASVTRRDPDDDQVRYKQQRLELHRDLVDAVAASDVHTAVALAHKHALHNSQPSPDSPGLRLPVT